MDTQTRPRHILLLDFVTFRCMVCSPPFVLLLWAPKMLGVSLLLSLSWPKNINAPVKMSNLLLESRLFLNSLIQCECSSSNHLS